MSKQNPRHRIEPYLKITEAQQEHIFMYHAYFVLQWEMHEICEHFKCTKSVVSKAIHWVIDNKINIPPEHLLDGAIYACRERMKQNRKLLDTELAKSKNQDKRFIIDLNNQIRFDEDRLYKLQSITQGKPSDDENIRASDVLKLITAAKSE